jgi:dimethylamine/trimethylamine dehydrogenase
MRKPRDELYRALMERSDDLTRAGVASVTCIGDALAPGAIVHAVYSGHRHAREFDGEAACSDAQPPAPYTRDFPL